jgi:hypothetical protein
MMLQRQTEGLLDGDLSHADDGNSRWVPVQLARLNLDC